MRRDWYAMRQVMLDLEAKREPLESHVSYRTHRALAIAAGWVTVDGEITKMGREVLPAFKSSSFGASVEFCKRTTSKISWPLLWAVLLHNDNSLKLPYM